MREHFVPACWSVLNIYAIERTRKKLSIALDGQRIVGVPVTKTLLPKGRLTEYLYWTLLHVYISSLWYLCLTSTCLDNFSTYVTIISYKKYFASYYVKIFNRYFQCERCLRSDRRRMRLVSEQEEVRKDEGMRPVEVIRRCCGSYSFKVAEITARTWSLDQSKTRIVAIFLENIRYIIYFILFLFIHALRAAYI